MTPLQPACICVPKDRLASNGALPCGATIMRRRHPYCALAVDTSIVRAQILRPSLLLHVVAVALEVHCAGLVMLPLCPIGGAVLRLLIQLHPFRCERMMLWYLTGCGLRQCCIYTAAATGAELLACHLGLGALAALLFTPTVKVLQSSDPPKKMVTFLSRKAASMAAAVSTSCM